MIINANVRYNLHYSTSHDNIEFQKSLNVIMSGIRSCTGFHGAKTRLIVEYKNEGRGVTSARLRFWHDVCHETLQNYSIKLHFKLPKLTKILSKIR